MLCQRYFGRMLIALAVEYIAAKGWFVVTTNVNGSGALMLAMFVV